VRVPRERGDLRSRDEAVESRRLRRVPEMTSPPSFRSHRYRTSPDLIMTLSSGLGLVPMELVPAGADERVIIRSGLVR
jgi:hypothetical protein